MTIDIVLCLCYKNIPGEKLSLLHTRNEEYNETKSIFSEEHAV